MVGHTIRILFRTIMSRQISDRLPSRCRSMYFRQTENVVIKVGGYNVMYFGVGGPSTDIKTLT